MNRPPEARWADTELPESLARALASAQTRSDDDAAALSRMRERLQSSIGAEFDGFDEHVPAPSAGHALVWLERGKWLAASAIVTAGLTFFGVRATVERTPKAGAAAVVAPATHELEPKPEAPAPPLTAAQPTPEVVPPPAAGDHGSERREHKRARNPRMLAAQPGLAEELKGVEHIRQQLKSSPAQGLAAAEEQQRVFAHGVLAPERELLRIEALLRLGRVSEAKARAARARSASGDQPYRDQIEKLLSTAER